MPNQSNTLRVGVIGIGAFAEQCHLPGLHSHPQAEVVAICGRRSDRLRSLADRFNVPAVHTDYRELCARSDLDAITIATANRDHAEHAIAAFAAGKHVFCEKPMATSVTRARQMVRAAEESGKIHQMAFTYRYLYGVQELRRRVRRGDIGVPHHLRAHVNTWEGLDPTLPLGFCGTGALEGGGVLFDMGPHLFDLARFMFGPIEVVTGFSQHVPRRISGSGKGIEGIETDDLATAWFRHTNGVHGNGLPAA